MRVLVFIYIISIMQGAFAYELDCFKGQTVYYKNGQTFRSSGGTFYYPNGQTFRSSGGTFYYPNGKTLRSSAGTLYYSDGQTLRSGAGSLYHSNGQTARSSGGRLYSDNGYHTNFPQTLEARIGSYGRFIYVGEHDREYMRSFKMSLGPFGNEAGNVHILLRGGSLVCEAGGNQFEIRTSVADIDVVVKNGHDPERVRSAILEALLNLAP